MKKTISNKNAYITLAIVTLIFGVSLGLDKGPLSEAINANEVSTEGPGGPNGGACVDNDLDGYNTGGSTCGVIDPNDGDKFIFPGAPEWCDGKDNNSDGKTDYINSSGDLCSVKDCYGNICKFILTWNSLGSADYPILNRYDLILTNAQNASKAANLTSLMITHRPIVESGQYGSSYFDWDTISSHEDWFMHDNGSRMQNQSYPQLWLMDMSQSAYRNFVTTQAAAIGSYPALDGYFYDNFVNLSRHAQYVSSNYNGFNVAAEYDSSTTFDDYMQDVAYRIKRSLGNKLIFGNNHAEHYREYFDGYMAENWVHNSNVDGWPAGWYPESRWVQDVETARSQANRYKYLILQCNNSVHNTNVFHYCFASYLMAKEQGVNAYFGYSDDSTDITYNSIYDIDLGAPTQSYQKIHSDGLYQRNFTNGKVLINPTDNKTFSNIDLGGVFVNLSGTEISTTTLASHRAVILFNTDADLPDDGSGESGSGDDGGDGSGEDGDDLTGTGEDNNSTSTPDLPPDETLDPLQPTDQSRGRLLSLLGRRGAAVYWILDGKKYVFPDEKTYMTWFRDFDDVEYVTLADLDAYPNGGAVPYRAGTNLITHSDTARVYAVGLDGELHWIESEQKAVHLYGLRWMERVRDVIPGFFSTSYTIGDPVGDVYIDGTLIQKGADIYLIQDGKKRRFTSIEAFFANGLHTDSIVLVTNIDIFATGADINGYESGIARASGGVASSD